MTHPDEEAQRHLADADRHLAEAERWGKIAYRLSTIQLWLFIALPVLAVISCCGLGYWLSR